MGYRKRREEKRLSHFADGAETSVIAARSSPEVRGVPDCRESFEIRSLRVHICPPHGVAHFGEQEASVPCLDHSLTHSETWTVILGLGFAICTVAG